MTNAWLGGENQNMGSKQREVRWLTPKPLVESLGSFDLDSLYRSGLSGRVVELT